MRRHESLIPLSRFHRSILFLALISKKNAPDVQGYPKTLEGKISYAIPFYEKKLQPHFRQEEEKLFPFIKNRHQALDRLVDELLFERKELHLLFGKLKASKNEAVLNKIGELLEKHVRKEERQLFQKVQEIIPGEELQKFSL